MRLPKAIVEKIRRIRPTTHELGGTFVLDDEGTVVGIDYVEGERCRDAAGKLTGGKCGVQFQDADYVFHTHPRANRPSSGDLYGAVAQPRKGNYVVTPQGLWQYTATPALVSRFERMGEVARRRALKTWRFLGHMEQARTEANDCNGYLAWARREGFSVNYWDFASLPQNLLEQD